MRGKFTFFFYNMEEKAENNATIWHYFHVFRDLSRFSG